MPELRRLSGPDVVGILINFGFEIISQRGSHVKMRRSTSFGEKQTLTIPNHKQLDIGTCKAIYRQVNRYIPNEALKPYFYQ